MSILFIAVLLGKVVVSYRYLIPVWQKHPEALYAFKSRGFGGEVGLVTVNIPLKL
jgi:hypothetical protein